MKVVYVIYDGSQLYQKKKSVENRQSTTPPINYKRNQIQLIYVCVYIYIEKLKMKMMDE